MYYRTDRLPSGIAWVCLDEMGLMPEYPYEDKVRCHNLWAERFSPEFKTIKDLFCKERGSEMRIEKVEVKTYQFKVDGKTFNTYEEARKHKTIEKFRNHIKSEVACHENLRISDEDSFACKLMDIIRSSDEAIIEYANGLTSEYSQIQSMTRLLERLTPRAGKCNYEKVRGARNLLLKILDNWSDID